MVEKGRIFSVLGLGDDLVSTRMKAQAVSDDVNPIAALRVICQADGKLVSDYPSGLFGAAIRGDF